MEMEREHAKTRRRNTPLLPHKAVQHSPPEEVDPTQERSDKSIPNSTTQGRHPPHTVERPEHADPPRKIPPSRHSTPRRTPGRMLEDEHISTKSLLSKTPSKQNHVCTTTDARPPNNRSLPGVTTHRTNQETPSIQHIRQGDRHNHRQRPKPCEGSQCPRRSPKSHPRPRRGGRGRSSVFVSKRQHHHHVFCLNMTFIRKTSRNLCSNNRPIS